MADEKTDAKKPVSSSASCVLPAQSGLMVWVNPIPMECGMISLGSERVVPRFTLCVSCTLALRHVNQPILGYPFTWWMEDI